MQIISNPEVNIQPSESLLFDLPESKAKGKVIPHEIFQLFINLAKLDGSLAEKQKLTQKSGIFFFTDKFLLKISLFSNYLKFPEDKLRSFFFSNIFTWKTIPQFELTRLLTFHYIVGSQTDWLLFEYPSHDLIDELIQILFLKKMPTYELLQEQKYDNNFTRKKVFSTTYYDSISIEPSEKMDALQSSLTLEEILSQYSVPNPRKDKKCWLLTQD